MSIHLPLQRRLYVLQQQCPLQRRLFPVRQPSLALAVRAFSSTPPTFHKPIRTVFERRSTNWGAKANALNFPQKAPDIRMEEMLAGESGLRDDVGLLEGTMVRANFSSLPSLLDRKLWKYLWSLVTTKGQNLFTRIAYRRCIEKRGLIQYTPIDMWKRQYLRDKAKEFYKLFYENLAAGNFESLKETCLKPLHRKLQDRIKARGPFEMEWKLKRWKSVRIVSDRVGTIGAKFPDSAYRQVIVRLASVQALQIEDKKGPVKDKSPFHSKSEWKPRGAKHVQQKPPQEPQYLDNGKDQKVVEYLVMQRRVYKGKEGEWQIWGFAEPSTPESIQRDEEHQQKVVHAHAKSMENRM